MTNTALNTAPSDHDRFVGTICLIPCPAISGIFLGLVAALCVYPSDGGRAVKVGAFIACAAFVANGLAICLTAAAADGFAQRQTHSVRIGARSR